MTTKTLSWPRDNRIAVAVTVMYEAWSEGNTPTYSVHDRTYRSRYFTGA
jgi:hypothetical protein